MFEFSVLWSVRVMDFAFAKLLLARGSSMKVRELVSIFAKDRR